MLIKKSVSEEAKYYLVHDEWSFAFFSHNIVLFCKMFAVALVLCKINNKKYTSWLSFAMSNFKVVTFPLVSWVRCGA